MCSIKVLYVQYDLSKISDFNTIQLFQMLYFTVIDPGYAALNIILYG